MAATEDALRNASSSPRGSSPCTASARTAAAATQRAGAGVDAGDGERAAAAGHRQRHRRRGDSLLVAQRRKQIGVRRALGARRADIAALLPHRELPDHERRHRRPAWCWPSLPQPAAGEPARPAKLPACLSQHLAAHGAVWVLGIAAVCGPAWRAARHPALPPRPAVSTPRRAPRQPPTRMRRLTVAPRHAGASSSSTTTHAVAHRAGRAALAARHRRRCARPRRPRAWRCWRSERAWTW